MKSVTAYLRLTVILCVLQCDTPALSDKDRLCILQYETPRTVLIQHRVNVPCILGEIIKVWNQSA